MSILKSVFSWRMLIVLLMGFSSGLPLLLIGGTLKAWLRQDHVDLSTIGFFSLAGLPYTIKFLWAPLMDRFVPFRLRGWGRRKTWLLLAQLALVAGFIALAFSSPSVSLGRIAVLAVLVGFFSASQDIAVDAYRREILSDEELGFGSSLAINGYRVAIYIAGALALILAGAFSWKTTYFVMAAFMLIGIGTTLFCPEPDTGVARPKTIREAVVGPFREFFTRRGAILILAFILLYKLGDAMANEMLNPFYLDMGYTLEQIGAVAKAVGLIGTISGAALGGIVMIRIGISRSLWLFGFFQAFSTLSFLMLIHAGHSLSVLALVIGTETFATGMATSAYAGYMASITHKKFTATQYALLSSLMGIPRVIFGATTGVLAQWLGWGGFFVFCALLAIPGLVLLGRVAPWSGAPHGMEPAQA
jgi:PAT family beta-lactamase induction signal transducer AmpG